MKVILVAFVVWTAGFNRGGPTAIVEPMPDAVVCQRVGQALYESATKAQRHGRISVSYVCVGAEP